MELPKKAEQLLDMVQSYSDLQGSYQVLVPFNDLANKFTTSELELAENFLFKNKIFTIVRTRQMQFGTLSECLDHRDEIIDNPTYQDAEIDFYMHGEWMRDAIKVYELGNVEVSKFLEKESILKIGDKQIELTPSKNEFELCRSLFQHKPNEWVDWSLVYLDMNGGDVSDVTKEKKAIRDTYARLNERIEKETGIKDLFIWRGNSIKRRM